MTRKPGQAVVPATPKERPQNDAVSLLAVITSASRDPKTDVVKLEKLMGLYERVRDSNAKAAYTRALGEAQQELPEIPERGGIRNAKNEIQSKYALWEDINTLIKPVLSKHGFALSFRVGQEGDKITVTGVLSHREGHSEQTTMFLPSDTSGSKNAVQAVGSSISYGKRYTAQALLNLTSRGEDDDGMGAGGNAPITDEQFEQIQELIDKSNTDIEKYCAYMKVGALKEIRARDFDRAVDALKTKLGKKKL